MRILIFVLTALMLMGAPVRGEDSHPVSEMLQKLRDLRGQKCPCTFALEKGDDAIRIEYNESAPFKLTLYVRAVSTFTRLGGDDTNHAPIGSSSTRIFEIFRDTHGNGVSVTHEERFPDLPKSEWKNHEMSRSSVDSAYRGLVEDIIKLLDQELKERI